MNESFTALCRTGLTLGFVLSIGCAPSQFTTATIYESPQSFVRLEVDRNHDPDRGHNHPADISSEQMSGILGGLVFEEPVAKLPFYDDLGQPRRHPALTEPEIVLFAPLLAAALKKAGPDEIVTFYHSTAHSGSQRLVTSGGVFVEQNRLHIVFGNYRSPTHFNADSGVADTTDERLTPLRALAPQRGRFTFEPRSATEEGEDSILEAWFRPKRQEIIIDYKRIRPPTPSATPAPRP